MIALSMATAACSDSDTASPGQVDQSGAYTAIVEWQAGEQEPVVNDDGTVKLPVIWYGLPVVVLVAPPMVRS